LPLAGQERRLIFEMDVRLVMNVEQHLILPAIFAKECRQRLHKAHDDLVAMR